MPREIGPRVLSRISEFRKRVADTRRQPILVLRRPYIRASLRAIGNLSHCGTKSAKSFSSINILRIRDIEPRISLFAAQPAYASLIGARSALQI